MFKFLKRMFRGGLKVFLRKCFFYSKDIPYHRSYSQVGEDLLLVGFLGDKWGWDYKGFYVDIGAFHPTMYSNTKKFYEVGWHGINVDASREAISLFKKKRKKDINVNVGIGITRGNLDYFQLDNRPMSTFSKEFADAAIARGDASLERIVKIPVITMEELLDTYLPENRHIDFISIDCEGLDLEILKSNNWDKYRPDFILIEIHTGGRNWEIPKGKVAEFLRQFGYELIGQSCVTSLFGKRDIRS